MFLNYSSHRFSVRIKVHAFMRIKVNMLCEKIVHAFWPTVNEYHGSNHMVKKVFGTSE